MSVEDTLVERGKRYGDFTDHAAICQKIKLAFLWGPAKWTALSDVQKQALDVIADKIARILSGDPNYADNWHDIQGYAKLVEDRLPRQTPAPHQEGETIIVHTPEQRAAIYAALGAATNPEGGKISFHLGAQPKCPECGYPADSAGTHYATCSRLTAPEEYKAEAQVAFEEAAGVADALARQVSAGTQGENYCPQCGAAEGAFHKTDCTVLRRGKSRLGKTLAELRAKQAEEEPAAAMDDDSQRMKIIGQGGEMAEEVYAAIDAADAFAAAPEWAKYKAQDMNGQWYWYECPVYASGSQWVEADKNGRLDEAEGGEPNPNWRDTLITRT